MTLDRLQYRRREVIEALVEFAPGVAPPNHSHPVTNVGSGNPAEFALMSWNREKGHS